MIDLEGCNNQITNRNNKVVDVAMGIALQCFHRIDVLINNIGFRGNANSFLDLKESEWNKVLMTNLILCLVGVQDSWKAHA